MNYLMNLNLTLLHRVYLTLPNLICEMMSYVFANISYAVGNSIEIVWKKLESTRIRRDLKEDK